MRHKVYMQWDEAPKHIKKAKKCKAFGIRTTHSAFYGIYDRTDWFATEKARDASYDDMMHKVKILFKHYPDLKVTKIARCKGRHC